MMMRPCGSCKNLRKLTIVSVSVFSPLGCVATSYLNREIRGIKFSCCVCGAKIVCEEKKREFSMHLVSLRLGT